MNLVTVIPPLKPPKCKDCKWSVKFNENTLICTRFKTKTKQTKMYEKYENFDLSYYMDTDMCRNDVFFCGTYGIYFEPK
jgi:hypothetical protein